MRRRIAHHDRLINAGTTPSDRFRTTCRWLLAEARRTNRVAEATRVVRDLITSLMSPTPDVTLWHLAARAINEAHRAGRTADLAQVFIAATQQIRQEAHHASISHRQ